MFPIEVVHLLRVIILCCAAYWDYPVGDKHNYHMNRETQQSNSKTKYPLYQCKSMSWHTENILCKLSDEDLKNQYDYKYRDKHHIFEYSGENINFIIDLPWVHHVKNLKKHKWGENNRIMPTWPMIICLVKLFTFLIKLMSWVYIPVIMKLCFVFWYEMRAIE